MSIKNFFTLSLIFSTVFSLLVYYVIVNSNINLNSFKRANRKQIFCLIVTSNKNIDTKVKTVYNSWVHKCDTHKFITIVPNHLRSKNYSENTTEAIEYRQGFHLLQPPGLISICLFIFIF